MNQAASKWAVNLWIGQLWKWFEVAPEIYAKHHEIGERLSTITNYGPNAGTLEFRKAVAENQWRKDGNQYSETNVLSTVWVQQAMYTSIGTLNKLWAKRVLIPEINFGIYHKIPKGFDMEVETYKLTDDFWIDLNHLNDIIREDDVVILNPVWNPTGKVLASEDLQDLGSLLEDKLTVWYAISDEIYDELVYDEEADTWTFSKYFDRTIVCNWVSKSGAMAWARVGWIVSQNEKLIQAMTSFNTGQISWTSPINQTLALPVVRWETQDTINGYHYSLIQNRGTAMKILDNMWLPYVKPEGSFYIFPSIWDIISDVKQACINAAQDEKGVVVIPGEAFGAEKHVRISFASNVDNFEKGMNRFKALFNR